MKAIKIIEIDVNRLNDIARKHNLCPKEAYNIFIEIKNSANILTLDENKLKEQGYKGDIHSQEE